MSDDAKLLDAAKALCRDVNGIDWNATAVQADVDALLAARDVSSSARAAALDILVERLRASRLEDADGVAHVAISAGTLVERGAPPRPLAEVLLGVLPQTLAAARRYADTCLAAIQEPSDADEQEDVLARVDDRAISYDVFRAHVASDRPGACALHRLREWVLPTAAALTRDRDTLRRACADPELRKRAAAMRVSEAFWLHVLLGVELDARWRVLSPRDGRGFWIVVDGVVNNFQLHTLVAAALVDRGLPGARPPDTLVQYLGCRAGAPGVDRVEGVWNFYDWRAAAYDVGGDKVPDDCWVWNEGVPHDVPEYDGARTLVVGPATIKRGWRPGRPFSALAATVRVEAELSAAEVGSTLAAMRATAKPRSD